MVALDAEVKQRALRAAQILNRLALVRAAFVFGSRVEGGADRWSDIDVAVFMDGIEDWDLRRRAQTMFQVQKEAGLEVEAHLFSSGDFDRPPAGSFAQHIIAHGIQLDLGECR